MATTNDAMFTQLSALYPSGGQTLGDLLTTYWSSVLKRTNLVSNPNFETNITGWAVISGNSSIASSSTDAYIGTKSLEITMNTTGGANSAGADFSNSATYRIPCVVGQTFTASAYIKNTVGIRNWRLQIQTFNTATSATTVEAYNTLSTAITNPTTWTRASATYTLTDPLSLFLEVRVVPSNTGAVSDKALVDAVLCESVSTLLPYFDGTYAESITNYTPSAKAWNGTTNLSTSTANYLTPAGTNTDYSYRGSEAYDYYKFEGATGDTLGDLANDFWNNHTF